jgi:hypothetical protein
MCNDRVRAISGEYLAERRTSIVQLDQDKGMSIVQLDQDKGLSSKQDREGLPATPAPRRSKCCAVSTLSTYSPREKEDLLIASRSIRELLRIYGRQLSAILLRGGA